MDFEMDPPKIDSGSQLRMKTTVVVAWSYRGNIMIALDHIWMGCEEFYTKLGASVKAGNGAKFRQVGRFDDVSRVLANSNSLLSHSIIFINNQKIHTGKENPEMRRRWDGGSKNKKV